MKKACGYGVMFLVICGLIMVAPKGPPYENMMQVSVMMSNGYGHGSGVMYQDGMIITAGHVVDVVPTMVTFNNGTSVPIIRMWRDPVYDIGFVWVDPNNYPTVHLGHSKSVRVGDTIYHVGTPLDQGLRNSLFKGILAQIGRTLWDWTDTLQIDAWSAPGCSGGPVFDQYGSVIGIVVAGPNRVGTCAVIVEPVEHIREALKNYEEAKTGTIESVVETE